MPGWHKRNIGQTVRDVKDKKSILKKIRLTNGRTVRYEATMNALTKKWNTVEEIARSMGVTDEAMRKWRERDSIPPRWHLPLIAKSKGKLRAPDFLPREPAQ